MRVLELEARRAGAVYMHPLTWIPLPPRRRAVAFAWRLLSLWEAAVAAAVMRNLYRCQSERPNYYRYRWPLEESLWFRQLQLQHAATVPLDCERMPKMAIEAPDQAVFVLVLVRVLVSLAAADAAADADVPRREIPAKGQPHRRRQLRLHEAADGGARANTPVVCPWQYCSNLWEFEGADSSDCVDAGNFAHGHGHAAACCCLSAWSSLTLLWMEDASRSRINQPIKKFRMLSS